VADDGVEQVTARGIELGEAPPKHA